MRSRILIGIAVTLLVFVVARRISRNKPVELDLEYAGARVTHTSVFEQVGPGRPRIDISIDRPGAVLPLLLYRAGGDERLETLTMEDLGNGFWSALLPALERGARIEYGFRLLGTDESLDVRPDTTRFFTLKYKGEVSATVLVLHILFIFAAFFFMVESMIGSASILARGEPREFTVAMTRWVVVFTFIGGWPLGIALNWQRFGVLWEGFPFGYDITDNKTQLMFLFWVVVMLVSWRSFFGRRTGRDLVSDRFYAWVVMASALASLLIILLPHSL